jgi:hypothetical protein
MNCERVLDSGAYVLGALVPRERDTYERHLVDCEICQHEVAGFGDLPGLLAQLDPAMVAALATAPGPVTREAPPARAGRPAAIAPRSAIRGAAATAGHAATDLRARRRRRRGWQFAGAALVAACLAVGTLVTVNSLWPRTPEPTIAMRPAAATVPVRAEIGFVAVTGGTEVLMHCTYIGTASPEYAKWTYLLVVVPRTGGEVEQISSWRAGVGDDVRLSGVTRLSEAEIGRVELRAADGRTLLSYQT